MGNMVIYGSLATRNDDFPVRYVNVYQMVNYDLNLCLSPQ